MSLLAGGMIFSSTAAAQDDSGQAPPKRQPTAAAVSYPDDELPGHRAAATEDPPRASHPAPRDAVDSPSIQPWKEKKTAGTRYPGSAVGTIDGDGDVRSTFGWRIKKTDPAAGSDDEVQPTRGKPSAVRHVAAVDDDVQPAWGKPPAARRVAAVDEGSKPSPNDPFAQADNAGDETGFGFELPRLRGLVSNRVWVRSDALLWWLRGGETPPLLTTSPASTPQSQAGVLGQPGTTVLFGDQELNTGLHAGGRLSFGMWLDGNEQSGLEFSCLLLGQNEQTFGAASSGNPILAQPYFDVNPAVAAENSHLIAYPNFSSGTFNASSTENFETAEALWRRAIVRGSDGRIDLLAGYRFASLTDGLEIDGSATSGTSGVAPAGVTVNAMDTFHTHNNFNGGELGFATQWHRNRWSFDTLLKLGIGQTNTQVYINGYTTVFSNGVEIEQYHGGFLAQPTNMGYHDSQQFSVMPEVGCTVGYDLSPHLKATLGYSLLYWSNVARPGDQIDTNLDSRQFPPAAAGTFVKPEFALHTSDFWAQGVNLGLDYRF